MDAREEVIERVTALVWRWFKGDWHAAFLHFSDASERLGKEGLGKLLVAAGFGDNWKLNLYIRGILSEMDANRDGSISWTEFEAKFKES